MNRINYFFLLQYQTNMENLYSPSYWSKRLSQKTIVQEHVKITSQESIRAKSRFPFITHKYGEKLNEKMNIFYGKSADNNQPIFVYFSGGYWQELCGDISAYVVAPICEAGLNCIIVDYSRAPNGNNHYKSTK